MDSDDRQTGRILTRREALALLGTAGALAGFAPRALAQGPAGAAPPCIVTPEQMEGPFFVNERLNRADIRSDPADGSVKEGVPLTLTLRLSSVSGGSCAPLAGAMVDIWHCDAAGAYSAETAGRGFLRGYQVTDAKGAVRFATIYPGSYSGRAVHIHFKVRGKGSSGRGYDFTSQLYFDEAVTDRVYMRAPYTGQRQRVRNERDGLFRRGGDQLMLALAESGPGYAGTFDIGMRT
jgi:protocatechuate 3,4-dioxygenase beta subunit